MKQGHSGKQHKGSDTAPKRSPTSKSSSSAGISADSLADIIRSAVEEVVGPRFQELSSEIKQVASASQQVSSDADGMESISEKILRGALKGKTVPLHFFILTSDFRTDPVSGDYNITRSVLANKIAANKSHFSRLLVKEARKRQKLFVLPCSLSYFSVSKNN